MKYHNMSIVVSPSALSFQAIKSTTTTYAHTKPRSLEGKTPSEAAGIEINGQDKWLALAPPYVVHVPFCNSFVSLRAHDSCLLRVR